MNKAKTIAAEISDDTVLGEALHQKYMEDTRRQGMPWVNNSCAYLGTAAFPRGDWELARERFARAGGSSQRSHVRLEHRCALRELGLPG